MSKQIRKLIPYLLVLTILIGLFFPMVQVNAAPGDYAACIKVTDPANCKGKEGDPALTTPGTQGTQDPTGTCTNAFNGTTSTTTQSGCVGNWTVNTSTSTTTTTNNSNTTTNGLGPNLPSCAGLITGTLNGCVINILYIFLYMFPHFLLYLAAMFFNALIAIGLNGNLFNAAFVAQGWAVVRDVSNIFFILVLLYVAVQTILGVGGHGVKNTIARVIIMALLINFSMFFTEIIIDTSNVVALVFYNKITVNVTRSQDGTVVTRGYIPSTNDPNEKDFAGGLVSAFEPDKLLSADFFKVINAKGGGAVSTYGAVAANLIIPGSGTLYAAGKVIGSFFSSGGDQSSTGGIPLGMYIGLMITSGLIMLFAAYAFFIVGLTFLSRLIELWIMVIFSPFAFMSFTIPILEGIDGIGWKDWIKRLLEVAFMAPIFMFFLYLIFLLVHADLFNSITRDGVANQLPMETVLFVTIPAVVILILLHKATERAKKASGELGSMIIKGTEIAMGVVGGLALGTVGVAGQATLGRFGAAVADSQWAKKREAAGQFGGKMFRSIGNYAASSSFDARKGAIGSVLKAASGVSGINLKSDILQKDGGFRADRKKYVEKEIKRAKDLEVGEDEEKKQNVYKAEAELQSAKTDQKTQDGLVKLNNGDGSDTKQASINLVAAEAALAADPANPALIAAKKTAEDLLAAGKGLGGLEREANTAQRKLADAERELKDTLNEHGKGTQQYIDAKDRQLAAFAVRETTRENLENRQAAIRTMEAPIHTAEKKLKLAQNAVVEENRQRRTNYAETIPGFVPWGRLIGKSFGPVFSGPGNNWASREEAANKIRSGTQAESIPASKH